MSKMNNFSIKPALRDRYKIIAYQKCLTMRKLLESDIVNLLENEEQCYKAMGTPECSATLTVAIDSNIKEKMAQYKINTGATFRDIVITAMTNRVIQEYSHEELSPIDLI